MGNDNHLIDPPPLPSFNTHTTAPSAVTSKDGIVAFQTPVEPMESRQTLLDEKKFSPKIKSSSSRSTVPLDKIFALALFILLVTLISYILFHNRSTDNKLNRLNTNSELKSSDLRQMLDEINRRLQMIEHLLLEQNKKFNLNLQLNAQDIREFSANQTALNEFLRRYRERL